MRPTLSLVSVIALLFCSTAPLSAQDVPDANSHRWVSPAHPAPRVQQRTFQSAVVRSPVSYHIYIPEIYESTPERRFPVMYWLHGSGGAGRA